MIFSLFALKVLHISFFMFSISLGGTPNAAWPSSLYIGASCDARYVPTSSHVSAPSKLPMVTSVKERIC